MSQVIDNLATIERRVFIFFYFCLFLIHRNQIAFLYRLRIYQFCNFFNLNDYTIGYFRFPCIFSCHWKIGSIIFHLSSCFFLLYMLNRSSNVGHCHIIVNFKWKVYDTSLGNITFTA